jgi:hypothetical protein
MQNRSVLRLQLQTVLLQMVLVIIISGAVSFCVNMTRSDSIPVVGDWSTEGRVAAADGSSWHLCLFMPVLIKSSIPRPLHRPCLISRCCRKR